MTPKLLTDKRFWVKSKNNEINNKSSPSHIESQFTII